MTSTSATIRPAVRLGGGVAPLVAGALSGGGVVTPEPTSGLGDEATATGSVAAAATVAAAGPASMAALPVVGVRRAASTSVELAVELAASCRHVGYTGRRGVGLAGRHRWSGGFGSEFGSEFGSGRGG